MSIQTDFDILNYLKFHPEEIKSKINTFYYYCSFLNDSLADAVCGRPSHHKLGSCVHEGAKAGKSQ